MDLNQLYKLIDSSKVELICQNHTQERVVEAVLNNDPETRLALNLIESGYELVEIQRNLSYKRADFNRESSAIAALYILIMGTFLSLEINQDDQKKIRDLAQTQSPSNIDIVKNEIERFVRGKYISCDSLKKGAVNLTKGNDGYSVLYVNDIEEKIFITKGRRFHFGIGVLFNYGLKLQQFMETILPPLLTIEPFSRQEIETFKRLYLGR